jgi:spermidine/putrescine-binding protein
VRVLGWPDYTLAGIKEAFEARSPVNVEYDHFDQNEEAFATLSRDPERYDVVLADGLWPRKYADEGLVMPLRSDEFTSWEGVDPLFQDFALRGAWAAGGTNFWAYPANWSLRGLVWDPARVASIESFEDLWCPELAGHVWTNSQGSEIIAETALSLGLPPRDIYSLEADDLARTRQRLLELAPRLGGIWMVLADLEDAFLHREAWIAEVHTTALLSNLEDALGRPLAVTASPGHAIGWIDGAMISSATSCRDEAVAFIDFLFSVDGFRVQWEESDGYAPTNRRALEMLRRDPRWTAKVDRIEHDDPSSLLDGSLLVRAPQDVDAYLSVWEDVLQAARGWVPKQAWRGVATRTTDAGGGKA